MTKSLQRNQWRNHCSKTIGSWSVCSQSVCRCQSTWLEHAQSVGIVVIPGKADKVGLIDTVRFLAEVESRTQGSRPKPRTQKKSEAKDSLSEGRHSRGQGQECSRPRPRFNRWRLNRIQKTKKLKNKDQGHKRKCSPKKKGLHKNFSSDLH